MSNYRCATLVATVIALATVMAPSMASAGDLQPGSSKETSQSSTQRPQPIGPCLPKPLNDAESQGTVDAQGNAGSSVAVNSDTASSSTNSASGSSDSSADAGSKPPYFNSIPATRRGGQGGVIAVDGHKPLPCGS